MTEDYGIKSGSNINTNTDVELDLTSKYGSLKVYKWDTVTITPDGNGDGQVDVTHDLNYAPSFLVFVKNGSSWYQIGAASDLFLGDASAGVFAYTDTSKLRIQTIGGYSKLAATSRTFKYYLLVDKAQAFTGQSNISLTDGYGFKISQSGKNVLTGEEYEMAESSKYKSLQYFTESLQEETLTLPAMWSSIASQDLSESQYVDFNHGLGYSPLFFSWFKTSTVLKEAPYNEYDSVLGSDLITQEYYTDYDVSAICDSTKIRVQFKRKSKFDADNFDSDNNGSGYSPGLFSTNKHLAQTITVRVLPFAENLEGLNNG